MKEATGELSTTVIAIVAIAAILTIFTTLLLPTLRNQIAARMHCADAICPTNCTSNKCNCTWFEYDNNGNQKTQHTIICDKSDRDRTTK